MHECDQYFLLVVYVSIRQRLGTQKHVIFISINESMLIFYTCFQHNDQKRRTYFKHVGYPELHWKLKGWQAYIQLSFSYINFAKENLTLSHLLQDVTLLQSSLSHFLTPPKHHKTLTDSHSLLSPAQQRRHCKTVENVSKHHHQLSKLVGLISINRDSPSQSQGVWTWTLRSH